MKGRRTLGRRILMICLVLVMSVSLFAGCGGKNKDGYTVTFDVCTNLETNKIKDREVKEGELISQPNVYPSDVKYSSYVVEGWYTEPEYTTKWDFTKDKVYSDMVLYAKWEKQFFVRYFVSNQKEPRLGVYVMEGEYPQKQDYLIPGCQVLGYYKDSGYTEEFDFSEPVQKDTDVYMKMSESFWWDGKSISEVWTVAQASGETSKIGNITYVENEKESYAKVDFGYSELPDGRIAVSPGMDMTKSQILTIKYKNLGNSPGLRIYWTVRYEDGTVSGQFGETMAERTWDFAEVELQSGMSEEDDWATLTLDMGKLSIINGASQWANGKTLEMLRFDSRYHAGVDKEYVDDVILFKEISFSEGEDQASFDSVELKGDDVFEVMEIAKTQESVKNGLVFPKDRTKSIPKQGTKQYNMTDCVTYLFPYGSKYGIVSYDFSDMKIDMETNQKIYIRYKNEGFGTKLTVRYRNTEGKTGETILDLKKAMQSYGTLDLNMMNEKDWSGTLDSIDLIYRKKDTNNVFSVEKIYVLPFEATKIPGINFVDDKCAGFESNKDYKIAYDSKSEASFIQMQSKKVTLEKKVSIDTSVYTTLDFTYSVPMAGLDEVTVGYKIGGVWYTEKITDIKRTSGFETATFDVKKKGIVTAMKIVLEGKGRISIRSLEFKVDQAYALDFSDGKYVADYFLQSWLLKCGIDYDSVRGAVSITGSTSADARVMFYLGTSGYRQNIALDSVNKKVYVCYNNPGKARTATLGVYYAGSDNLKGSGIAGHDATVKETKVISTTAELKGNMKDGEWAVAAFDFNGLGLFSADRNATMISFAPGGDIYLRAFVLD